MPPAEQAKIDAASEYVAAALAKSVAMLDAQFHKGYARANPALLGRLIEAHAERLRAMTALGAPAIG